MINLFAPSPADPNTSVDLGWLIQSQEVSDEAFCEALLLGWESQIERLALPFLESPSLAGDMVDQVICRAILERGGYRGHISGAAWLDGLVVDECLRRRPSPGPYARRAADCFQPGDAASTHDTQLFKDLGSKNRLLLFLRHERGLTQAEIAALLKLPLDTVQADFHALRQSLHKHQQTCPQCAARDDDSSDWEAELGRAAVRPLPEPQMRPADTAASKAQLAQRQTAILEQASRQRRHRQRQSRLRQAAVSALFVIVLLALGRFAPRMGTETRPLPVAEVRPSASVTPTPSRPARAAVSTLISPTNMPTLPPSAPPPLRVTPPPPEDTPSLTEILQLARDGQNTWQSLWADVQVSLPDLSGSAGVPVSRKQVWVSRPSLSRVISGPSGGDPSETYTTRGGLASGQDFQNGRTFERAAPDLISDADLRTLFAPGNIFIRPGSFRLRGSGQVAARTAWVLDWTPRGSRASRLWIDAKTGVILRHQEYEWPNQQRLIADVRVDSIAFDPAFSPALFTPGGYRGDHFAHDFAGTPEINPPLTPLDSFDPAHPYGLDPASRQRYEAFLAQQTTHLTQAALPPDDQASVDNEPGADPRGTPQPGSAQKALLPDTGSLLSCQRSPDLKWLAYILAPSTAPAVPPPGLYVSEASNIQSAWPALAAPIPIGAYGDYAFSPDSRRLAFFGCGSGGPCGVFVLDLRTGARTRLLTTSYADYLLWSPDGRALAMVSKQDTAAKLAQVSGKNLLLNEIYALSENWHYTVLDAATGEIQYERLFLWSQLAAPPDSPTHKWGVSFKAAESSARGCG